MKVVYGVAALTFAALMSGCSAGSVVLTPAPKTTGSVRATATPSPKPSPAPTATIAAGATPSAAQVNASLQSVQTLYQSFPHSSVSADLATLAGKMVASGTFTSATVTPGGITAQLPGGAPALVFADHLGDAASSTAQRRTDVARYKRAAVSFPSTAEAVGILENMTDKSAAFDPAVQAAMAAAFQTAGFSNATYSTLYGGVDLETIAALQGHPLDFLSLSTHGMVAVDSTGAPYYAWLSDSPIDASEIASHAADIAAGKLLYSVTLFDDGLIALPQFAFTPAFLLENTTFVPGAIFDNQSCYGQYPSIASAVSGALNAAGVGRYYGWNNPVVGVYGDQSDTFLVDRLLGEGSGALWSYAAQRTPPQRPFPLDDIYGVMQTETRTGPLGTNPGYTYAQSPGGTGAPPVTFLQTDFGAESAANPPLEYALPSIASMSVAEGPTSAELTISGNFPTALGTVTIADPSAGSTQSPLAVTSWTSHSIVALLPVTGANAKGAVTVISAGGIASNAVNLTQWNGQLSATENVSWSSMGGTDGIGSGTIVTTYFIDFRADVHPVVPAIDTTPAPQNLAFGAPEFDSSAQMTSISGTFESSDGKYDATLGLNDAAAPIPVATPPVPGTGFDVGTVAGQPSSCNSGMPGISSGSATVFCPEIGYKEAGAGTCSDTGGSLCTSAAWTPAGIYGSPSSSTGGVLTFTMDPTSYAITVSATDASGTSHNFESESLETGSVSGTINGPVAPPTTAMPSVRRRTSTLISKK